MLHSRLVQSHLVMRSALRNCRPEVAQRLLCGTSCLLLVHFCKLKRFVTQYVESALYPGTPSFVHADHVQSGVGQKNKVFEVHSSRCGSPAPPSSTLMVSKEWIFAGEKNNVFCIAPAVRYTPNIEEGGAGEPQRSE